MWFYTILPPPSGGTWGFSSAPRAPFLVLSFPSHVFCLMGRVSFLFAVPCAYLTLFFFFFLSCRLCYLCGSCLHAFLWFLSATIQILACPLITHIAHILTVNMLKHCVCPCHNTYKIHTYYCCFQYFIIPISRFKAS